MSKTILITGASTGIGHAAAAFFQAKGWNVIATMRTPEKETELNKLDNVLVTRLDVQDADSITAAIEQGLKQFGQIDVLLNNAGYGLAGTFESISKEAIANQYEVNVFGLFDVTRAVLPHMRANKSGVIINVSSVGGRITFPLISLYHSTKWAVEGFSEALLYEMEPFNIKVKIVEPGGVNTDFGSRSLVMEHNPALAEEYNNLVNVQQAAMQEMMKPENMSTPELVAEVIYNAATDDTNKLRYVAGADAEQLLAARQQMNDEDFIKMMKANLQMG